MLKLSRTRLDPSERLDTLFGRAVYQRLVARLTVDWPAAWSKAREDDVEERLRESLATDENVALFHQYMDYCTTTASISQEAAFLVGVEVGRQVGVTSEPVSTTAADTTPKDVVPMRPFAPAESTAARCPTVEDILYEAGGVLRLMEGMAALTTAGDRDYTIPTEATTVLERLTNAAADQLAELENAMPGRLATMTIEDLADGDSAAATPTPTPDAPTDAPDVRTDVDSVSVVTSDTQAPKWTWTRSPATLSGDSAPLPLMWPSAFAKKPSALSKGSRVATAVGPSTRGGGVRLAEVKRAEPLDVDLERRLWFVRTTKGGEPRAIWLNEDMFAAWTAFVAAKAWGPFDSPDYTKALYGAGWPRHVRPYNARHAVGIELGERGADLEDIQGWLGHKHIQTTRKHYVPVLSSRLKQASERLAGRFGGWAPDDPTASTETVTTGVIH